MTNFLKKLYLKLNIRLMHRLFSNVLENTFNNNSKNISRFLQYKALKETAEFVESNLTGIPSFKNKYQLLNHAINYIDKNSNGIICEFGVYQGGTISFIAKKLFSRQIYGFDSFEGLPESWNFLEKGAFKMSQLPKVPKNVELIKGWFDDTLPVFQAKTSKESIDFFHIDSDLYSSAKMTFKTFYSQFKIGSVIVFDEFFNYPGWKSGEAKAFFEFIDESKFGYQYLGYCNNSEQLAIMLIKK